MMNCRCCGVEFEPKTNAQVHCSVKCRVKYNKYKSRIRYKTYACNWCGKVFDSEKKKKYCSDDCRLIANRMKKNKALKHNNSIEEIARLATEAGLSYGQYVHKYNL